MRVDFELSAGRLCIAWLGEMMRKVSPFDVKGDTFYGKK